MISKVIDQPYLRFNGFYGSWKRTTLGDISSLITKGTTPSFFSDDGVTFVKIESLNGYLIEKKFCAFITKEIHEKELRRSRLEESDILFAIAGATVGKVGVVEKDILPANTNQALAIIRLLDKTLISFVLQILTSKAMKKYIYQSVSVGAQPNLSLKQIAEFTFNSPSLPEQQKIASFLSAVDERIELLERKKEKLEAYKKGVMQQLFSQQIRFKQDDGSEFPDWEEKRLGEVLKETKLKNTGNKFDEVFSVAKQKGVINQIEHLGRSYAAESIEHYKVTNPYDVVYTKSPTSDFPFGIIKQNLTGRSGVLSPLYGVFKPQTPELGTILHNYFSSWVNTYNYLVPIVQKGAKNTMNINNDDFLNGAKIRLPMDRYEQKKITAFLNVIDENRETLDSQIQGLRTWKKGLLQQMFV